MPDTRTKDERQEAKYYRSTHRSPYKHQIPNPNVIHYRDGGDSRIRIWRGDWFDDQFEVMEVLDFKVLQSQMQRLGFTFQNHTNED